MSRTVNQRARALGPLLAPIALAALLVAGCDQAPEVAGPALLPTAEALMARMARVDVCHQNVDGEYVKISVAEAAYETHVAHGDGSVGDPVPGRTGYEFDEDCQAAEIPLPTPDCPCYSAAGVAETIMRFEGGEVLLTNTESGGSYESILQLVGGGMPFDWEGPPEPLWSVTHEDGSMPFCTIDAEISMGPTSITESEADVCRSILLEYGP